MLLPDAAQVAAFLGQGDSDQAVALAEQSLPIITAMARSYTRDNGFSDENGNEAEPDLCAVVTTATARLMANPEQLGTIVGSVQVNGGFTGWSLAETFVLNRYRRRAA